MKTLQSLTGSQLAIVGALLSPAGKKAGDLDQFINDNKKRIKLLCTMGMIKKCAESKRYKATRLGELTYKRQMLSIELKKIDEELIAENKKRKPAMLSLLKLAGHSSQ